MRVETVEKTLDETRLVVVHDVHVEVCEVALAVSRGEQFFAHALVAFDNGNSHRRGKLACQKQSACAAAYNDNVEFLCVHTAILAHRYIIINLKISLLAIKKDAKRAR